MSRTLVLTHTGRAINISTMLDEWASRGWQVHSLDKAACKNLAAYLRGLSLNEFDRVLVDIPFKHLVTQADIVQYLPSPVFYEEDACQNFIPESKWYGRFERVWRNLSDAAFVVTGHTTAARLGALGLHAIAVPKGYDPLTLGADAAPEARDIALGFVGTFHSPVYRERQAYVEKLQEQLGLVALRTESRQEYRDTLNRIQFFFSADINLGEYMAKNFEAMACGCIVLAYRQGDAEESRLGLKDGENIVLYSSVEEAISKYNALKNDPERCRFIAENAVAHAAKHHAFPVLAARIHEIVQARPPRRGRPVHRPVWAKITSWLDFSGQGN